MLSTNAKAVTRVQHPLKIRAATVQKIRQLSPHIVSVTLAGESLRDFASASFDDHVKLMLPPGPGLALTLPATGPSGPVFPEGAVRPIMRDYTPRSFDAAGTLDIEMVLHGHGPAGAWAMRAKPGDRAGIGGPKGSLVIPTDFDYHLLIGDESSLPAIARRLEELPAVTRAIVIIGVEDAADRRELSSRATTDVQWVTRKQGDSDAFVDAITALRLPPGEGYAWAAGEAAVMASVRRSLLETHKLPRDRVRVSAYWKHGVAGHHEASVGGA
jgi:NADPH-dependent ferric siderophore reductase